MENIILIYIIIGIVAGLIIILAFTTWNLLRKVEKQEDIITQYNDYVTEFNTQIKMSEDRLKQIDEKGMFKSDDEIGWFFQGIKEIQEYINDYNITKNK